MEKRYKIAVFFLLESLFISFGAICDTRTENIDVFLVLDKSLSMVEEIEAVKTYVNSAVIDRILIPGDRIVCLAFYGEAKIIIDETVQTESDKESLKKRINSIQADGRFTDIGNALDMLKQTVDRYSDSPRRKFLLLITDGKQEAPPQSKYYSPDGSFNHQFLENTKIMQRGGWKIHVLGLGSAQTAKEIAQELAGTYAEIEGKPDQESIERETKDFLSSIELVSPFSMSNITKSGRAVLSFTVKSTGYSEEQALTIQELWCSMESSTLNILESPFTVSIPPGKEVTVQVPVLLPTNLEPGQHEATLRLTFDGRTVLVPSYGTVTVNVNGFFKNNILYTLGGVIILAILIVVVRIVRNIIMRKREEDEEAHKIPIKNK